MTVPVSEIAQQRTVRLIRRLITSRPCSAPSSTRRTRPSNWRGWRALTSRRLTRPAPYTGIAPGCGRTFISAAFSYRRKGGNRFNGETRGAWYAGFDDRTSLHEVAFHKTRELSYIDRFHDDVRYRALHASFIGRFHDIRGASPAPRCLDPDVAVGYPAGQALAEDLIGTGSRGLIYPSVRNPGGTCLVAFEDNAVQDVTPGACWRIVWDGSPNWTATAV